MKVFIGGSRKISSLGVEIRRRIDRMVEKHLPVVAGDANGADKAVQRYLHERRCFGCREPDLCWLGMTVGSGSRAMLGTDPNLTPIHNKLRGAAGFVRAEGGVHD